MRTQKYYLVAGIIISICLSIGIPFVAIYANLDRTKLDRLHNVGDALGGLLGPFIAFIAALLSYAAFYAQIRANKEQREQFQASFKQQQDTLSLQSSHFRISSSQQSAASLQQSFAVALQRFTDQYYLMLTIHRENAQQVTVSEWKGNTQGAQAFENLFENLKFLFWKLDNLNKTMHGQRPLLLANEIFQISYLIFHFGMERSSRAVIRNLLETKYHYFFDSAISVLSSLDQFSDRAFDDKGNEIFANNAWNRGKGQLNFLSSYFRHLFQLVSYVDKQPNEIISVFQSKIIFHT